MYKKIYYNNKQKKIIVINNANIVSIGDEVPLIFILIFLSTYFKLYYV